MNCYGYPWPEILRCDQYPADHLVCISSVTNTTVHTGVRRGENMQTHNYADFIKPNQLISAELLQCLRQAVEIVSWRRALRQRTYWRPFAGVILVSTTRFPAPTTPHYTYLSS